MHLPTLLIIFLFTGFPLQASGGDINQDPEIRIEPALASVTIFPNGAQLTHYVSVEIPGGSHTLIFTGLNRELDASSTTIALGGNAEITSVNHRVSRRRATTNADSIAALEAAREMIEQQIRSVQIDQEVIDYEMEMLSVNREPEAGSTDSLRDLLILHRERIRDLKTGTVQLADSLQFLRNRLNEVNRALQQPGYQPYIMQGELLVEVDNPSSGTVDTEISYPVSRAGWEPEYELRAQGVDEDISGKLAAIVYNNTNQTWQDVEVTLSTRTPQRGTTTPELDPWFLDFFEPQMTVLERRRAELDELVLSGNAESADLGASLAMPPPSFRSESMIARQFMLRDRQTIESGNERSRLTLEEYSVPADFTYFSVPKIQEGAILLANIPEWEETFLLPGSAMLHLEGTFVGETYLNPQTVSDTLEVSFGRDSGIVVTREKAGELSERSFFRNRVTQTIAHEISIRNTKGYPVEIELMDQIPVSVREEIEVTATELSGGELSEETGFVNWLLTVEPSEMITIELVYEVRHPSGQNIRLE